MNFLSSLSGRTTDETIVVDAENTLQEVSGKFSRMDWIRIVSPLILLVLVGMSFFSFGSLVDQRDGLWQQYFQLKSDKQVEEQNLESLQALTIQRETVQEDQSLLAQVVPRDPHYEQVLRWIDGQFLELKKSFFAETPELISWKPVSSYEVTNPDLQVLGITEYRFSFLGQYEAFLEFLSRLRNSRRVFDLRSIRNLSLREDGFISADVAFWAYHLDSSVL